MSNHAAAPLPALERADILDALRGFALFGILLTHVPSFSGYDYLSPEQAAVLDVFGMDRWMSLAVDFFIDGKFVALFSLLFGLGFAIQMRNASEDDSGTRRRFVRRMLFLLAIGLAHLFLLWQGDILTYYALLGLVLLPLRKWRPGMLVVLSIAFLLLPALTYAGILAIYIWAPGLLPGGDGANVGAVYFDRLTAINDVFMHGSYAEALAANFSFWLIKIQWMLFDGRFFTIFGMFLLGAAFGKWNLHYWIVGNGVLLRLFPAMLIAGGLGSAFVVYWRTANVLYPPSIAGLFITPVAGVARPVLALAYAAGLCLLWSRPMSRRVLSIFTYPGRMALTTYLSQTVICIGLFYGFGLGFGGSIGETQALLAGVAIFLAQAFVCRLWLARFRFGPAEWIWRQATYGQRLAIRTATSGDDATRPGVFPTRS